MRQRGRVLAKDSRALGPNSCPTSRRWGDCCEHFPDWLTTTVLCHFSFRRPCCEACETSLNRCLLTGLQACRVLFLMCKSDLVSPSPTPTQPLQPQAITRPRSPLSQPYSEWDVLFHTTASFKQGPTSFPVTIPLSLVINL